MGAYLSGGIDSTFVTAMITHFAKDRLRSFSVAFGDREFDESDYQREASAYLGTQHQEIRCSRHDIGRIFPDVIRHIEQPVVRTASAPMYMLSKLVHQSGFKIFRGGNVMIDSLVRLLPMAQKTKIDGLPEHYALVALHRPANVDDSVRLKGILESLREVNRDLAVVFPVHPRTRRRIADFRLNAGQLHLLDPCPYVEFLALQSRATVVITDSGGIQEETTYLGVPCLTVRENTERPITVSVGTNVLVGRDPEKLRSELSCVLAGRGKKGTVPPLWDGRAGERIADILVARGHS